MTVRNAVDAGAGAPVRSLSGLREAENACRRCPLYRNASQAVPGEGRRRASIMLVGEQPGDQEDRAGHPFIGPAGRLLDQALAAARIDRGEVFVTNAVKHFKHQMRGKRRLHKRPNAYEIDRCRWWLEREIAIVRPELVIALGATAARSLFGRPVAIGKSRGRVIPMEKQTPVLVTIHPAALLRIRERADRAREYEAFVDDLRRARDARLETSAA
jgi:DNA polymerase